MSAVSVPVGILLARIKSDEAFLLFGGRNGADVASGAGHPPGYSDGRRGTGRSDDNDEHIQR